MALAPPPAPLWIRLWIRSWPRHWIRHHPCRHGLGPGLGSRMASVSDALGALVADLDPDTLAGADATALYAVSPGWSAWWRRPRPCWPPGSPPRAPGRRRATAPRPGCSPPWRAARPARPGARWRPASAWAPCPRSRRPSGRAGCRGPRPPRSPTPPPSIPGAETLLLAGSERRAAPGGTKERCQRFRATSARHDPLAGARRIHAQRSLLHWTDAEGAFCFTGRDTPERGAALLARLVPAADRLRHARRAAAGARCRRPTPARVRGRPPGRCPVPPGHRGLHHGRGHHDRGHHGRRPLRARRARPPPGPTTWSTARPGHR